MDMYFEEVKGQRREDFIKREAQSGGVSVAFFKRMMKHSNQVVVECGCGHIVCKNRGGLLLMDKYHSFNPTKDKIQ